MNNDREQSSESENEDRVTVIENLKETEIIEDKECSRLEYEEAESDSAGKAEELDRIAELTVETLRVPVISSQPDLRHSKITG